MTDGEEGWDSRSNRTETELLKPDADGEAPFDRFERRPPLASSVGMRQASGLIVPLPDELYESLRSEAGRVNVPATKLARQAIEKWLSERRNARIREAVAEYALSSAGTLDDLDEDLERAGIEHLLDQGDEA